jgi:zinc transport system permease protein
MFMIEILQYGFMQRAIVAGLVIGLICPLVGIFLVLRRMSLIGDSLSHVALSGVAAGILAGFSPVYGALLFSVIAAVSIEFLRKVYSKYAELSIAIILSAGIGVAVILISLSRSFSVDLFSYLFGSINTVTKRDLQAVIVLGVLVVLCIAYFFRELFFISFDEEGAILSGIKVDILNLIFIVMIALVITVSMRIVGILLVSSLMVIPVATGLQIAKSFKQAVWFSVLFAEISILAGIVISYYFELASGGTIVVFSVVLLLAILLLKKIIQQ